MGMVLHLSTTFLLLMGLREVRPSGAPRKDKMMVAFSANGVVNKIGSGGIGCRVQAGGAHELDYEEVMNQVLSRSTVK